MGGVLAVRVWVTDLEHAEVSPDVTPLPERPPAIRKFRSKVAFQVSDVQCNGFIDLYRVGVWLPCSP